MRDPRELYRFHVENLREIEITLKNISLLARAQIAKGDPSKHLRSLLRLYALVLGCWAETRLRKLLYEQGGFDDAARGTLLTLPSKLDQWKASVDLAFRQHHHIGHRRIDRVSLGVGHFARNQVLHEVLDRDLAIVIQIRNKLAHGQWVYPLNDDGTSVNSDYYRRIKKENLLSLQFKYALLKYLAELINDLVVSPATFRRDFDMHFRNLEQERHNLNKRSYSKYEENLIRRRTRYRERKASMLK